MGLRLMIMGISIGCLRYSRDSREMIAMTDIRIHKYLNRPLHPGRTAQERYEQRAEIFGYDKPSLYKWVGWGLAIELITITIAIYIYRWAMILLWAAYGR